ncbi:MAG TPA: hypothetical protein VFN42_04880, partial [Acetobacteraceae bacterium]|nr:hypothetical protein [Acetobacteraceae bacterium]
VRPARHVKALGAKPAGHASHHVLHAVRPHHAAHLLGKAARPRHWVETVCRLVPGALLGGGLLLAPPPATRTAPLPQPAPMVQPLPAAWSVPLFLPPPAPTQPEPLPPPDLSGTDPGHIGDVGGGGTGEHPVGPLPSDDSQKDGAAAVDEAPGAALLVIAMALLALARSGRRRIRAAD